MDLSAFVARDRRLELSGGLRVSPEPEGAVLFVDLSGSTRLAESLGASHGEARGAEEFSRRLAASFEPIVEEVHRWGGCIVEFVGDALVVLIEGDDGRRAVATAAALRGRAEGRSEGSAALRVKVGIAVGRAQRMSLGDPSLKRLDALVGPAVTEAQHAEAEAQAGDIILSAQRAQHLGLSASVTPVADGWVRLDDLPAAWGPPAPPPWPTAGPAERAVAEWVLPEIVDQDAATLMELRPITAVFLRLPVDLPLEQLDRLARWVQRIAADWGGSVLGVTAAEKGGFFFAVWGAPRASEEDSVRALTAAAAWVSPPAAFRAFDGMAAGVATGRAWAGVSGTPGRRVYNVHGQLMNRAARVMALAETGEVLADDATARRAQVSATFVDGRSVSLRGIDAPVLVQRLVALEDAPAIRDDLPQVIGRGEELVRLSRALASEPARCVLIRGEAGIGKTTLLRAATLGTRALDAAASSTRRGVPLHVFAGLARDVVGGDGPDALAQLLDDDEIAPLLPLLGTLAGLDWGSSPLLDSMSGDVRLRNTGQVLEAVSRRRAGSARLLRVEDLQWADSASWQLLQRFVASGWRVVIASRPLFDAVAVQPADLDAIVDETIDLGGLDPDHVAQLTRQVLGTRAGTHLATRVHDRTSGHPYFALELLRALLATERVEAFGEDDTDSLLPWTVEALLVERIDQLSPAAREGLKIAAVLGDAPNVEQLVPLLPDDHDATQVVTELAFVGLLERDGVTLRFCHALARNAAYGLLPHGQRRLLHGQVAQLLADQGGEAALLAHHWLAADRPDRALPSLDGAAEGSLRQGAFAEAVRFTDRADELDPHPTPAVAAQRRRVRGAALLGLGQIVDAHQALEASLSEAGAGVPAGVGGVALAVLREIAVQAVRRWAPALSRSAREPARDVVTADTLSRLVPCYFILNRLPQMMLATLRSLNLAEAAADGSSRAQQLAAEGHASMSVVFGSLGMLGVASRYRTRALDGARATADLPTLARVHQVVSLFSLGAGRLAEAGEDYEAADRLYRRIGDNRRLEETLGGGGWLRLYQGRYEEAATLWEQVLASGGRRRDRQSLALGRVGVADARFRQLGRDAVEACRPLVEQARRRPPEVGDAVFDAHLLGLEARLAAATGDAAQAHRNALAATAAIATESALAGYGLEVYGLPAEVLLSLAGRGEAPVEDAAAAVKQLGRFARSFPLGRPRHGRCLGWLAHLQGRPDAARAHWQGALDASEDQPVEAALLRAHLGEADLARRALAALDAGAALQTLDDPATPRLEAR